MFKCSVKIDLDLQKEVNRKSFISNLVMTILGAVGLGFYIVFSLFFESVILEVFLWISAFMLAYGIMLMIMINLTNKKSASNNYIDNIELVEDYLIISTIKNEEVISNSKVYYKDLTKIRETENYLLLYINRASVVPIPKRSFSPEDYSKIKVMVYSAKQKN